jgi:hypothetical protein
VGPKIPKSYGGISGGGLWELHVELDKELKPVEVNKRLHGVAFRQSDDHRRITSNAGCGNSSSRLMKVGQELMRVGARSQPIGRPSGGTQSDFKQPPHAFLRCAVPERLQEPRAKAADQRHNALLLVLKSGLQVHPSAVRRRNAISLGS